MSALGSMLLMYVSTNILHYITIQDQNCIIASLIDLFVSGVQIYFCENTTGHSACQFKKQQPTFLIPKNTLRYNILRIIHTHIKKNIYIRIHMSQRTLQSPASPLLPKFMTKASSRQSSNSLTVCLKYPDSAYKAVITLPSQNSPTLRIQIDSQTFTYSNDLNLMLVPQYDSKGDLNALTLTTGQDSLRFFKSKAETLQDLYSALSTRFSTKGFSDYFRSLKRLGRGGFATVYLVQHKFTKALYAVKVFNKHSQLDLPEDCKMLDSEIKIMKSLNHKYLIKMEGIFETEYLIYLAMEYLDGGSLAELMKTSITLKGKDIQAVLRCVLEGLQVLDSKNIMHRDINPANILLKNKENKDHWVISDFGLSAYSGENYHLKSCGTPGYIAPEVIKAKEYKYNQACDMFGLGVIACELILKRPPYERTLEQMYQSELEFKEFELKEKQKSILHPAVASLLQGMLRLDPSKRLKPGECLNSQVLLDKTGNVCRSIDAYREEQKQERIRKYFEKA